MNEDLISNNFVDHINRVVIKRNVRLSQIGLFLSVTYAVVLSIDWYLIIQNFKKNFANSLYFYLYFIYPIVLLALVLLNIYAIVLAIKANKNILLSIENADAELFNEGYLNLTKASLLSIISFIISISFTIVRLFLK